MCRGGFGDKVDFVQVYEGDLESAFKNGEKIPYRYTEPKGVKR